MEKGNIIVNGLKIAYRDTGTDGIPVVFVHGNSGSSLIFEKQLHCSLAAKYRFIALDLPGHGESAWAAGHEDAYSVAFFTRMLAEFCRQFDCRDVVLVGFSMGGHIALETIPLLPDARGVVIFGTPPLRNPPSMEEAFLPSPIMGFIFNEELGDQDIIAWSNAPFTATMPPPDFYAVDIRRTDPKVRSGLGACVVSLRFQDEVKIAKEMNCPLAILHGEHESIVSLDYIQSLDIPTLWRGDIQLIPGASHTPQWEQPGAFNNLLGQYLRDIVAKG